MASRKATIACVDVFGKTDFRKGLAVFTVPTLVIHDTSDKTDRSSLRDARPPKASGARLLEYDGEPHGLFATVPDKLNADLIAFIG